MLVGGGGVRPECLVEPSKAQQPGGGAVHDMVVVRSHCCAPAAAKPSRSRSLVVYDA